MIEHQIEIDDIGGPKIEIENNSWHVLFEINTFSGQELREIVSEVEEVLKGEKEGYSFGHEVMYCFVCKEATEVSMVDFIDGKMGRRIELFETKRILHLLKSYSGAVTEWEQKTGKSKFNSMGNY